MKYNKLIRDRIPEIIKAKGGIPVVHFATDAEYWQKLKEKLSEEVKEFSESESMEELADVLEVIDAIISYQCFDKKELRSVKQDKALKRGAFKKRIILDES